MQKNAASTSELNEMPMTGTAVIFRLCHVILVEFIHNN